MRSSWGHVTIVKKLGLRRLGLAPVARGRSRGMHRDIGRRQGRSRYLEGYATGSRSDPPYWSPLWLGHSDTITTMVFAIDDKAQHN